MTENLEYTQQNLLAILVAKEHFIEKMTVQPNELDQPYSKILDLFIQSYNNYKLINLDFVFKKLTIEEQSLILEMMGNYDGVFYSNFVRHENIIHERTIQRNLDFNFNLYKNEQISLDELKEKLTIPNSKINSLLTEEELKNTLLKEQRILLLNGYKKLRAIGNFKETDLIVLAGYTGKGKSAMGLNLLNQLSKNYDCTYLNLEMSVATLHQRLISINSGITINTLERYHFLEKQEQDKILESLKFIKSRKITLINESQSLSSLKELVAAHNNKHNVFIIDHIGLLKSPGKTPYEKMTEIAKELRKFSLDYNTTIIALCQLSRSGAKGKPDLSMLRDSGEVEQSATKVMFIYSEDTAAGENPYINIAKNRDGMTATIPIIFNKYTQEIFEK